MTGNPSRRSFIRTTAIALASSTLTMAAKTAAASTEQLTENVGGMTVLFQGDSITDGKRGRNADPNHIMGHGYAFSIASRWGADFPSTNLVFYNRGISGNTVQQLRDRWQTDCLDLRPNLLSVLVGINDAAKYVENPPVVTEAVYIQAYEDCYRGLLQQVRKQDPKTILVLGLPFLVPVGKFKENWARYEPIVEQISLRVRKLATEFDAVLVDFQKVFQEAAKKAPDSYWVWDGIHPTVAGHELMAREWLKQVSKRIKFLKKYS